MVNKLHRKMLKKGIDVWNDWREKESIKPELRGADLQGLDFQNANLSNTNLSRANIEGANLSNVDLSNAELRGTYLSKASKANLQRTYLRDSTFKVQI